MSLDPEKAKIVASRIKFKNKNSQNIQSNAFHRHKDQNDKEIKNQKTP